jgi:hypothetical protein
MAENFGILIRLVLDFYFEKKIGTHFFSIVAREWPPAESRASATIWGIAGFG